MASAGVDHPSMLHIGQYLINQARAIQIGSAGLLHFGRQCLLRALYRLAHTRPDDRNRRVVLQANPARVVDIDILATVAQRAYLTGRQQRKTLKRKVRFIPRPIQLADIHTQFQTGDSNPTPGRHQQGIDMLA